MKKRIRLNNDKVKNLINKRLKGDGTFVSESKIDQAIKQYLKERKEDKDPELTPEDPAFSDKALNAFTSMTVGLYDIVDDLKLIQTKESDVIVDLYPKEIYAETFLEEVIQQLELVIESLEYLQDFDLGDFREEKGR